MASFGLTAFMLIAIPFNGGDRELGVVSAHASALERARPALIASPFGTIHAATFSLPRPLGTTMPEPPSVHLASIDSKAVIGNADAQAGAPVFPTVDRSRKGDFLAALPPPETVIETIEPAEQTAQPSVDDEIEAAARFVPFPEYDISMSLELYPRIPGDETGEIQEITAEAPDISLLAAVNDPDPTTRTSRLFFGEMSGSSLANIVPWNPGEEPIMAQRAPDAEIKRSALAALSDPTAAGPGAGESVTSKGEFNIPPPANSPAARLALIGTTREKAESCLTKAVYFESRGESLRGQIAVAQVILNRTFSGYYPSDVCDVVYQNAHRHNSCQFSFACDRVADVVTEPEAWDRAARVAKATLDGKVWLPEIGKATHYHAYWVKPWWVRTMRKFTRIGVHSFYRPVRWGDGEQAPTWGSTVANAESAAHL
jgi:Cell Wall Hydrolase